MRNVEAEEMITVTPRQLEGLIRLSTARARLLMKNQVEGEDAQRAIDLLQSMFEDAGIDVNTGKVDLGVLQGRPRSEVSKMQLFMDVMKSLEGELEESSNKLHFLSLRLLPSFRWVFLTKYLYGLSSPTIIFPIIGINFE